MKNNHDTMSVLELNPNVFYLQAVFCLADREMDMVISDLNILCSNQLG